MLVNHNQGPLGAATLMESGPFRQFEGQIAVLPEHRRNSQVRGDDCHGVGGNRTIPGGPICDRNRELRRRCSDSPFFDQRPQNDRCGRPTQRLLPFDEGIKGGVDHHDGARSACVGDGTSNRADRR